MENDMNFWKLIQTGHGMSALAGLCGGIVWVATRKDLSARDSIAAVLVGSILAAFIAPVVGTWIGADPSMIALLGLIFGIGGMSLVPAIAQGAESLVKSFFKRMGVKVEESKSDDSSA